MSGFLQALIDCIMYDDDKLMSAALTLLSSTYRQRRDLISALEQTILCDTAEVILQMTLCLTSKHVHTLTSMLLELALAGANAQNLMGHGCHNQA